MYCVPKIKRFNTITQQAQKSWRSNLSSDSKRNIILQDISQNLILIKEDLISFFENNKDYLFPTENEEYICFDNSSSIIPTEELLYRLIDILKNNDFISRLDEASSTIKSLSNQLNEAKNEIKKLNNEKNSDSESSNRSFELNCGYNKEILINKIKEKNLINQKISKEYDALIDDYLSGLSQKKRYEQKIKKLEENLKTFENTKLKNEELSEDNKQMKDELYLVKNELNDVKKANNKLYEDNIKTKDELQRLYKLVDFKNTEYHDLTEKNKQLLKDNYTCSMELQRKEEKLRLSMNNEKIEKEKNKEIIDDLEKQINDKEKEINNLRAKIKNNISNILEENKNGNFKYVLDEINNKLKILYKGHIICRVSKYNREIPTSFYNRKKYKINSKIHPSISDICSSNNNNNVNNYKPMTLNKNNNKICEINNFNITYKLSHNEYEFDYSGSSSKHSNNSLSHNSFRLDKLCEQVSDSFLSNSVSKPKTKTKIKDKKTIEINNKMNTEVKKKQKNQNNDNKNILRRSLTDNKIRRSILMKNNRNLLKNSFGFDIESIKEEKDEDNMSISNFNINLNSKKEKEKEKIISNKDINRFIYLNQLIESGSDSVVPAVNKNKNDWNNILVVNHVEDFGLNKLYTYPKNMKLNIKKINVKRIIHVNKNKDNNENEKYKINNYKEGCYIY